LARDPLRRVDAAGGALRALIGSASRRIPMRRVEVCVLGVVGLVGGLLLPIGLRAQGQKIARAKCASNLRKIALAALQYAGDKKGFPKVAPGGRLDGGIESSDTARKVRTLLWAGYHDDPTALICPVSNDFALDAANPEAREEARGWVWGKGVKRSRQANPLWAPAGLDPALNATHELSYAFTRQGHAKNVGATALLSADRAIRDGATKGILAGNHDNGWNVVSADASVAWNSYSKTAAAKLVGAERAGDGFLSIANQEDASTWAPLSTAPPRKPEWEGYYKQGDTTVDLARGEWDRRSRTWGVRGVVKRGKRVYQLVGRTDGKGTIQGTLDPRGGGVRALGDGDLLTLAIKSRAGSREALRLGKAKRPPPPLSRQVREEAALGFLLALRHGNRAAARAWLVPASKSASLDRLIERVQGSPEGLRALSRDLAKKVVRGKGGARLDLNK
jgi:hypothetical protein